MNKRQAQVLFMMCGASLAISVYALYTKKKEHQAINETYYMIRGLADDYHFAEIIDRYDDDTPGE